jgi:hypothetical protein
MVNPNPYEAEKMSYNGREARQEGTAKAAPNPVELGLVMVEPLGVTRS